MNYFVDTNMPIGYAIPYDKWHEQSVDFFNNTNDPIYWSNLVKLEYTETINGIIDDIEIFLTETKMILKDNDRDFSNYFCFENFILKRTKHCNLDRVKKTKILEYFWIKNNFVEGISSKIHFEFQNFTRKILQIHSKRDFNIRHRILLHNCGLDNYLKYYDYAQELYDNGVHKPDCKIVIDAHDCGRVNQNLIFVSNDEDMLEKISRIDTSHFNIIEFRSCNYGFSTSQSIKSTLPTG